MDRRYRNRHLVMRFADGRKVTTCLLRRRLTDFGVIIDTSGTEVFMIQNFGDPNDKPYWPLVECFEVDWNQSCTVPFDFDLLEETPEQELARWKKPRAADSRAVLLSTLEEIAGWLRKPSGCARTAVQERQQYLAMVEKVLAQHTTRK